MIQLATKSTPPSVVKYLSRRQGNINKKSTFHGKVVKAISLWNSKGSTPANKVAIDKIKQELISMSVAEQVCNYCETNESGDIEHIYPKSHFPERCFLWLNYIFACKTCNTTYKLDQFAVFRTKLSRTLIDLMRSSGVYKMPITSDPVLIDPRIEDPMYFMQINIIDNSFFYVPNPERTNKREIERAKYTIRILALNDRVELVASRKSACSYFHGQLKKYLDIDATSNMAELQSVVEIPDAILPGQPFSDEKTRLLQSIKSAVVRHRHPTVWREILRQLPLLPTNTQNLFGAITGIANW